MSPHPKDTALSVLADLEAAIDEQIFDELARADFDLPDDAEVNMNLPMALVRRISQVLNLANRTATVREGNDRPGAA